MVDEDTTDTVAEDTPAAGLAAVMDSAEAAEPVAAVNLFVRYKIR